MIKTFSAALAIGAAYGIDLTSKQDGFQQEADILPQPAPTKPEPESLAPPQPELEYLAPTQPEPESLAPPRPEPEYLAPPQPEPESLAPPQPATQPPPPEVSVQDQIIHLTNQIIEAARANGFTGDYEGLKGDLDAIVATTINNVNESLDALCPAYPFDMPDKPVQQIVWETVQVPIPHWVPALTPWEKVRMLREEVGMLRDQLHQCAVTVYESGQDWAANYAVRWGENFIDPEDIEYWAALARDAIYETQGVYIEPGQVADDIESTAWQMIGYWDDKVYWTKQNMIYQADWMAESLIYVATGNSMDVNIYPLDQMVTISQWEYSLKEWCNPYSGNCYDYYQWYAGETHTITSEDVEQAYQNHNGFLSTFYEQQYYEQTVYAGWYFDNTGDDASDLLWTNYYNLMYSSASPYYMDPKEAWSAAWDYTQQGIDIGDYIAVDQQEKANMAAMEAQAQADQIQKTYFAQQGNDLPKRPENDGQPAPPMPPKTHFAQQGNDLPKRPENDGQPAPPMPPKQPQQAFAQKGRVAFAQQDKTPHPPGAIPAPPKK